MPGAKKQPPNRNTGPWSSLRILNSSSPVASKDMLPFLVTCISAWDSAYDEGQKRAIIDSLPPKYRKYEFDGSGGLVCPIPADILLEGPYFRSAVSKFKTNLTDGFYEKGWQNQATRAMQERRDGKFDEYLREKADKEFGDCAEEQTDH